MRRGDIVYYNTTSGYLVRARVNTAHNDGSVTVTALFYKAEDGKDLSGYLGFKVKLGPTEFWAEK